MVAEPPATPLGTVKAAPATSERARVVIRATVPWRAVIALLGFLALVTLAIIPTDLIAQAPSVCVWKRLLGVECLTCGMTRAFSSLLHGDLGRAAGYNRLAFVVLPFLCVLLAREFVLFLRRSGPSKSKVPGHS